MDDVGVLDKLKQLLSFNLDKDLAEFLNVEQSTVAGIRRRNNGLSLDLKLGIIDKYEFLTNSKLNQELSPKSLAIKVLEFQNITENDRINIPTFILSSNGLFNDEELTSELKIESDISNKFKNSLGLVFEERIQLVQKLFEFDQKLWPLSLKNISAYCSTSKNLLNELIRISETVYLERYKRIVKVDSDSELADYLGVSKQHLSTIRKNENKIGKKTMIKILTDLEKRKSNSSFDSDNLLEMLENNESLIEFVRNRLNGLTPGLEEKNVGLSKDREIKEGFELLAHKIGLDLRLKFGAGTYLDRSTEKAYQNFINNDKNSGE